MKIDIIQAPSKAFIGMLMNNINSGAKEEVQLGKWGAVGLVQAHLIELYCAADMAEKASDVKAVLVSGNCPQHVQMLALFGNPAAVKAAIDKIRNYYRVQQGT